MPRGCYKRTEEHKRKISAGLKGKPQRPLTAEHKRKISVALKGKVKGPITEEHRINLSRAHKGQVSWNKGLTKETDERVKLMCIKSAIEKRKNPQTSWNKGKTKNTDERLRMVGIKGSNTKRKNPTPAWNKGLTKETDERVAANARAVSEALLKLAPNKGIERTMEVKDKISKANFGKKRTKEAKRKMREVKARAIQKIGGPRVSIYEKNILDKLEIEYQTKIIRQYRVIGYFLDGYSVKYNIAFEVDENTHFNCVGVLKERDIKRQKEIEEELGCTFVRIRI